MFSQQLIDRLQSTDSVVVLTGAGASAESGIPTFRDPGGLWDRFDPTELASIGGFRSNPIRVQSWYSARRANVLRAKPHGGHIALAELEKGFGDFTLVTQNVDGLHSRAGSKNVIEVHGSLMTAVCISCGAACDPLDVSPEADRPQQCRCGGYVRPAVIWFGELLDPVTVERAWSAAAHCDVFLSVGTGADVYPAASLPLVAAQNGAYVVEINPHPTAISSRVDEKVSQPAGTALPELVKQLAQVN